MAAISYAPITKSTADSARKIILEVLEENFGTLRMEYLQDVINLPDSYQQPKLMLVGQDGQNIVSTGAIVPEPEHQNVWRIMRMCIAKEHRRQGLASSMLIQLEQHAMQFGAKKLILTTVADWKPARLLYEARGYIYQDQEFQPYADQGGCWIVHYEKAVS